MKFAFALCFVTGLLLAVSDGPFWPWANLAGVAIFSLSPFLAAHIKEE